jgi:SAM-dependent methyltransferase
VSADWDDAYRDGGRPWGESPSLLAVVAVERLRAMADSGLDILDIGCGYGRDSRHLSRELHAAVLGVDPSAEGIAAAVAAEPGKLIEFRQAEFEGVEREVRQGRRTAFDVVFASNLYQLLEPREREGFRRALGVLLEPAGLLFLSTLSTHDPQHYGEGEPVPGERDSFARPGYLHFCREQELRADFSFLSVEELSEREYDEPHADGCSHRHVSWILVARRG